MRIQNIITIIRTGAILDGRKDRSARRLLLEPQNVSKTKKSSRWSSGTGKTSTDSGEADSGKGRNSGHGDGASGAAFVVQGILKVVDRIIKGSNSQQDAGGWY